MKLVYGSLIPPETLNVFCIFPEAEIIIYVMQEGEVPLFFFFFLKLLEIK